MYLGQLGAVRTALRERGITAITDEWLQACLQHVADSCLQQRLSPAELQRQVMLQWLDTDLTAIGAASLPAGLAAAPRATLRQPCAVQLVDAVDVSQPAYGQLLRLRRLDVADSEVTSEPRAGGEPRPSRALRLTLTDGVQTVTALETGPVPDLRADAPAGQKLLLRGPLECRRGVLLLTADSVSVLGGCVDELQRPDAQERLLEARVGAGAAAARPSHIGYRNGVDAAAGRAPPTPAAGRDPFDDGMDEAELAAIAMPDDDVDDAVLAAAARLEDDVELEPGGGAPAWELAAEPAVPSEPGWTGPSHAGRGRRASRTGLDRAIPDDDVDDAVLAAAARLEYDVLELEPGGGGPAWEAAAEPAGGRRTEPWNSLGAAPAGGGGRTRSLGAAPGRPAPGMSGSSEASTGPGPQPSASSLRPPPTFRLSPPAEAPPGPEPPGPPAPFGYLSELLPGRPLTVKAFIMTQVSGLSTAGGRWRLTVKLNDGTRAAEAAVTDGVLRSLIGLPAAEAVRLRSEGPAARRRLRDALSAAERTIIRLNCLMRLEAGAGGELPEVTAVQEVDGRTLEALRLCSAPP